jgi:two-component system sensor histidine kinase UhpB
MILSIMAIMVGMGGWLVIDHARASVANEMRASVSLVLQLVDVAWTNSDRSDNRLPTWLNDLAQLKDTRHLRIRVEQLPEAVVQFTMPTVIEPANAPSWFVWMVSPQPIHETKELRKLGGKVIHVSVEANPNDEIEEAWGETRNVLVLMVVLAGLICSLIHFTLGHAFASVSLILNAIEDVEQGRFHTRIGHLAPPEFDRIASAINHMAETLALARAENRALSQRSLILQETERCHIARELHDELGQSITGIRLIAASQKGAATPHQISQSADEIIATCDHLFAVVRAMMQRLRPLILDDLGLIDAIEDVISQWRSRSPQTTFRFSHDPEIEQYADGKQIHLYRIVQECLTNVFKHADATLVDIELALTADSAAPRIQLRIVDNGIGFDPKTIGNGFGLLGIQERIANLAGRFRLDTAPGQGTQITVSVPFLEETF